MTTVPMRRASRVAIPLAGGAAVAVALGVYGRVHAPTGVAIDIAGFSSFRSVKSWLATVALVLALVQIVTAMAIFGRVFTGRRWVAPLPCTPPCSRRTAAGWSDP